MINKKPLITHHSSLFTTLGGYIEEFLAYLLDVRGYSELSVETYEIVLRQMMEVSHFYEEDTLTVLDITPFRFKIVKNHKITIVK